MFLSLFKDQFYEPKVANSSSGDLQIIVSNLNLS